MLCTVVYFDQDLNAYLFFVITFTSVNTGFLERFGINQTCLVLKKLNKGTMCIKMCIVVKWVINVVILLPIVSS